VLAVCGADGCLPALHILAVTHHENTHKRVTIGVPANDGLVVLMIMAAADTFILERHTPALFLDLCLGLHGVVDVSNLVVAHRHQVDTSNLRNDAERVGVGPCLVREGGVSAEC
jgi:hypothetical protein